MNKQQMARAEMDEDVLGAAPDRLDPPAFDTGPERFFRFWEVEVFWPIGADIVNSPARKRDAQFADNHFHFRQFRHRLPLRV